MLGICSLSTGIRHFVFVLPSRSLARIQSVGHDYHALVKIINVMAGGEKIIRSCTPEAGAFSRSDNRTACGSNKVIRSALVAPLMRLGSRSSKAIYEHQQIALRNQKGENKVPEMAEMP